MLSVPERDRWYASHEGVGRDALQVKQDSVKQQQHHNVLGQV